MGTIERRAKEKDAKRRAILRAAIRCFAKSGYDATSLDDVARLAEVAKGTLYLYFPSKADLFATLLLEQGFDVFERELEKRRGLSGFARTYRELVLQGKREIFDIFLQIDRGDISDELRAQGRERLERILARLAEHVGKRGALVLWALCIGVAHLARVGPVLGVTPDHVLDEGMKLLAR